MGIYLGIGSNLGDRAKNLREASERLNVRVIRTSTIYETQPVGYLNQPWFLNSVIQIETDLSPLLLLERCQRVEYELGRVRKIRNGPRTIDIDLLFYYDEVVHTADLKLPHPRIPFRRFVLVPLGEIAPDFRHPILQLTPAQLLQICPDQSIVRAYDETSHSVVYVGDANLPIPSESNLKPQMPENKS